MNEVIRPTVSGMAEEGNVFTGFLYAGLMIAADGSPRCWSTTCVLVIRKPSRSCMRLRSDLVALSGRP